MQFEEIRKIVADTPYIGADEGRELYDFILRERPVVCLELGHAHGVSTCYLAAALQETGGRLDSVDLATAADRDPNAETLLARAGLSGIVALHREINSYNWFLKKKIEERSAGGTCAPCYDFCFIDGAKNWTIDGFAFFLVDKLLNHGGWLLFDDFTWTFGKHEGRTESDGITKRSLGPDEIAEPHVRRIFELLVMQHPAYSNFELQSDWWAWAQKVPDGHRDLRRIAAIGERTK